MEAAHKLKMEQKANAKKWVNYFLYIVINVLDITQHYPILKIELFDLDFFKLLLIY